MAVPFSEPPFFWQKRGAIAGKMGSTASPGENALRIGQSKNFQNFRQIKTFDN